MRKSIRMHRVNKMKDLNMTPNFPFGGGWSHYKRKAMHKDK